MRRTALLMFLVLASLVLLAATADEPQHMSGYSRDDAATERQWEQKFRAIPTPENIRNYDQRLSARPHNVGSAYDRDNSEWLLGLFKQWGLDAHIENFDSLYPTPK